MFDKVNSVNFSVKLKKLSFKRLVFFAFLLTLLSGIIPSLPVQNLSSLLGPFSANWYSHLDNISAGQISVWTFSRSSGVGFPLKYVILIHYGVECEAGGCGYFPFPTLGIAVDVFFYFILLLILKRGRHSWVLISAVVLLMTVLFLLVGQIPYPNRCPAYNDKLKYVFVDPSKGKTNFVNLVGGRRYYCENEWDNVYDKDKNRCQYDPSVGEIVTMASDFDISDECNEGANIDFATEKGDSENENNTCGYNCIIRK